MSFLKNIKIKLAQRILLGKQKKTRRKKEFHNLESASKIGILFDNLHDKNYQIVKTFSDNMSKKGYKVTSVGWINANELPDFSVAQKTLFYTNKDVKWTGEPLIPEIKEFVNTKFDLLFVLTNSDDFSIQYITSLSLASCKVGAYSEKSKNLDFMIDQTKNKSIENLINESLQFLTQIKKD